MDTRNITVIPFINVQPLKEMPTSKCPTKMDIFRFFFFLHCVRGESLGEAAKTAVKASKEIWTSAGITTKKEEHAIKDLRKIYQEYQVLIEVKQICFVLLINRP